ncbi:MAG: amino acid permease, partial [Verrucomicrobiota bacterium]
MIKEERGRTLSLLSAIAITVASMVGTGVFTSLGFQVAGLPAGFPILAVWLVGGILSLCGALCYGELAAMMPRNGGEYHLLSEAYHPWVGFLSGWVSVTVGFAAPAAMAGLAFGEYLRAAFPHVAATPSAVLVVVTVTMIHTRGISVAERFQVWFTGAKIVIMLVLIAVAAVAPPAPGRVEMVWGDASPLLSPAFALSLFWVMYSYSGWNAAAYLAGEIRNPARNVPFPAMSKIVTGSPRKNSVTRAVPSGLPKTGTSGAVMVAG